MKDLIEQNQDVKLFWKKVLVEIEISNDATSYKQIVASAVPQSLSEDIVYLACENTFIRNNLLKYTETIKEAITKAHKKEYEVVIKIEKGIKTQPTEEIKDMPLFEQATTTVDRIKEKQNRSGINPKYTFDNYIKGDHNQLAFAIAKTVANKPGEAYNPVFLYSGVGLGKTHLMQAIGNQIIQNKPGTKIVYTTGEQFTNELIEAIQGGKNNYTTNQFRNKFRKADVFLIDDVQFIIGKDKTQEEFFHTFNALYMEEKQIVITSDKPPHEFSRLPDRITSRFQSGMIVDIQAPSYETRSAILRKKRDANRDPVSNDVIDFIAEKVETNVRELEGAYLRVVTFARTSEQPITIELAAKSMQIQLNDKDSKPVNMNSILKAVCNYYSVKSVDVKGKSRTKDLVTPRQIAMYLIKDITKTPLMSIGDFLGGRDHTTVMHGASKIEEELKVSASFRDELNRVKQLIREV